MSWILVTAAAAASLLAATAVTDPVIAHACVALCSDQQDSHNTATQNCSAPLSCPQFNLGKP